MPLYAYRCTSCGHRFEKIQNFSADPELVCPVCQGTLERPLTAPRLHFKGAGWYVNDYAAKTPASESSSESSSDSSKPAAPAETKTAAGSSDSTSSAPASTSSPTQSSAPSPASGSTT